MAPKKAPPSDPNGIFSGITVFLVEAGVQARRFQVFQFSIFGKFYHSRLIWLLSVCCFPKIWKQKLVQLGAKVEESFSKRVTHIFAADSGSLLKAVGAQNLKRFKGVSV